jgi:hypothetical protein
MNELGRVPVWDALDDSALKASRQLAPVTAIPSATRKPLEAPATELRLSIVDRM